MPAPITIVTGLPRSGTSLVMQMLTAGGIPAYTDGIRTADDDNPRGYFECERVKSIAQDSTWLPEARGHVIKIIYAFLKHLPKGENYQIIHVQRPVEQVLSSQAKMLERRGSQGSDLPRNKLGEILRQQLHSTIDKVNKRPDVALTTISFEDLINDPHTSVTQLSEFLKTDLDLQSMIKAVDPTLHRQRSSSS